MPQINTKSAPTSNHKTTPKKSNSLIIRSIKFLKKTFTRVEGAVLLSSVILIGIGIYFFSVFYGDYDLLHIERMTSFWGLVLMGVFSILLVYKVSLFLFMLVKYIQYKPIASVTDQELPTCTIIVPAYNEGKQVWDTLMSLTQSDYPQNKLELLAIDDGSKDDTWEWMLKAKTQLGDRLVILQQPENKGKRHALYRGFNLGTGSIFVTVDSDSVVKEDTLRNLVSPFVNNDTCGAVAGNIRVLNNKKEMLPKMLDVSFVQSFEFIRSAESKLNSVLCTPGALAAYRSSAVHQCLPEWINQSFMGNPSDIGEDRAMTNMILKQGKHVLFQSNAVAYTNVPVEYTGLYKMFIRWGRSNVRENIEMSKYVFTNFRDGKKSGARLLFVSQFLEIMMSFPVLFLMLFFIVTHPLLFIGSTFLSILVISTFSVIFYAYSYKITEAFWAYSYSILYTFGLFWITPYAIVTANRRGWLTRGLAEKK
ncbi:glycosyltransferase family 2 protein [Psychroserpens sp. SPM9]|uniref:glycosyltransferase n=1 Tax=Psychroserpens sp. SPM9 TaxID=2975598 RepID=UPI0021A7E75F|nr:glycosyltransferase family 2 protein [Psychroserpens sp. SPM9]MDG5490115.1 glycosyltransferase family 2 protein [Psychroserpens sp. SPM9]